MAVYNSKIAKDFDIEKSCSFCGGSEVHCFWSDSETVRCCQKCALTVLPALVADAVVQDRESSNLLDNIDSALAKFEVNFWRACSKSLLRANNEK